MSDLGEEIRSLILRVLPDLSEETQLQLISRLQCTGLESKEDLKYVQQEDIADLLPVIQLRKLLDAFKSETETVTLDHTLLLSPTPHSCPSPLESSLPLSSPSSPPATSSNLLNLSTPSKWIFPSQIPKTWPETFQVPWERMPPEIRSAIASGKRPTPAARRQMVRVLVDEMRKYEANPTRSQCLIVCQNIVRQYPQSFADISADGSLVAGGHNSILIQVKTRIENLNRDNIFARHRAPRCSRSSTGRKRGPTGAYGCARFQPEFPPGETGDTLELKRQRLEEIFGQEGAGGVERAEVCSLMETTFCLLRRHINAVPAPTTEDIRSKWPYLFNQKSIYAHFELLTDLKVLHLLELALEECGRAIIEYFRSKPTNKDVQTVLSQSGDTEVALHVVQLLMAHFTETKDGLVLFADLSATVADVERTLTLPLTPRLILLGGPDRVTVGRWMISLEGHVLCEGIQPTFVTGLAALFSVYYIFNLQYQEEAACTLEFIQRRFIGINPERGTKASRGKTVSKRTGRVVQKKSATVSPRVSTLLRNLTDFKWNLTGRNKKKSVPMSELPEEAQRQKRAAWRAASRRYYARKIARQQANPSRSGPLPHITDSRYSQAISLVDKRRRTLISELPEESQTLQREAWRAASRRYYARKMARHTEQPTQYAHLLQNTEPSEETLAASSGGIMCS